MASSSSPHASPALIDAMMDAYVDWREECLFVADAYHRWVEADSDRVLAFAAYRAALDREQHASFVYARWVGRVEHEVAVRSGLPWRRWRRQAVTEGTRPPRPSTTLPGGLSWS